MTNKLKEAADKISSEAAQPILRSMYPTRSRNQMANEFRHFFISGAEWAREEVLFELRKNCVNGGKGMADYLENKWKPKDK